MPWLLFDDKYPTNRKVAGLGDGAFRLHTAAIFWCSCNRTDGFIAKNDVSLICGQVRRPTLYAAECVLRNVWHLADEKCDSPTCPPPRAEPGWRIHDYLEYQPSKNEIELARTNQHVSKSLGGRLGNHRRWHAARGVKDPGCPWCGRPDQKPSDTEIAFRSLSDRFSDRSAISASDRFSSPHSHSHIGTDLTIDSPPYPPKGGDGPARGRNYAYDGDDAFARFWAAFPKKAGKPAAYAAWRKALARGADPGVITAAARRYRDDPARDPGKTKYPQGWLNDERYADEAGPAGAARSSLPWDN